MIHMVVHTASGRFVFGGPYEPVAPDASYSVITIPDNGPHPDLLTQKWNGSAVVAMTADEQLMSQRGATDAATDAEDSTVIDALLDVMAATIDGFNKDHWRATTRAKIRRIRQQQKGL